MISGLLANEPFGSSEILYCIFDVCALLLITIIFFNYFFSKKIKNSSAKLFMMMIVYTIGASVADMLYLALRYVFVTPAWAYGIFSVLFYICYPFTGILFFVYTVAFIYEGKKMPKMGYAIACTLLATSVLGAIFAAVCKFGGFEVIGAVDSTDVYEYILYTSQLGAIIAAMVTTIHHRYRLRLHHRLNVYLFLVLNLVAAVMQQVLRWHVCCFALSVADLLIYITLQRPENELDAITGAFNGKAFGKRARGLLNGGKHFTVFATEINNISVVNSSFGMHGGNVVLREASTRIENALPSGVHLYRLAGVRFVTIFESDAQYKAFEPEFLKVFDEPFEVNGTKMRMSATACIIPMPDVTDKISDVEDVIRYFRTSAKTSDCVFVADKDVVERSRRREKVDYAIQRAIKNRSFEVYYQPIFSVKEDRINGCEALIRLNDPELGRITPDEFIPIAEQTGRIVEVGRFVMEEVCRFLRDEKPSQYGLEFVDVNLSVIQCMHPEIIEDIDSTLKAYGIPRSMVNLEVTETASAQSYALLQSRLNELHQSGFTISLDDFGTGFSSVEYLINFPFDVVKLDKSLVWAYMSTEKYEPILKHYMPMLHGLGTRIVAEGVETVEMVKALEELGCDYLQGYYFSRPVPKEKFIEYLKENSRGENIA